MTDSRAKIEEIVNRRMRGWDTVELDLLQYPED